MFCVSKGFRGEDRIKDVSFAVKEGQIVGLGGLDGQGQSGLMLGLFGLLLGTEGRIQIAGQEVTIAGPKSAKQPDIALAFIPEDRKTEGLVQDQSIAREP